MASKFSAGVAPYIYVARKYENLENGKITVAPSNLTVTIQDVDLDSGRTSDGLMHRNRVAVKRKLSITFPPVSLTKAHNILEKFSSKYFYVGYYDPIINGMASGYFYPADRSIEMHNYTLELYNSFSVEVVEV